MSSRKRSSRSTDKRARLPEPMGNPLPKREWQHSFELIVRYGGPLHLHNGRESFGSELLEYRPAGKNGALLVVDELPATFLGFAENRGGRLFASTHYYADGLHHRLSFHATLAGSEEREGHPAQLLAIEEPIRKIRSITLEPPGTGYLEIVVSGAPPHARVIESTADRFRDPMHSEVELSPRSRMVAGRRLQTVTLSEEHLRVGLLPPSKVELTEDPTERDPQAEDRAAQEEAPPETEAPQREQEGQQEQEKKAQDAADGSEPSSAEAASPSMIESGSAAALVALKDSDLRATIARILEEMDYEVDTATSFLEMGDEVSCRHCELVVLDVRDGNYHSVDHLTNLVREEHIVPGRFVIVGDRLATARVSDWQGLGHGMFLRADLPEDWIRRKLKRWLQTSSTEDQSEESRLILIADDDKQLAQSVKDLLNDRGYRVVTASDGEMAFKSARNLKPDLCILDIDMPEMTGIEALAALRDNETTAHLDVIMLTAHSDREYVQEALQLGIRDFIVKPFHDYDLLQRVRAALVQ